MSVKTIQNWLSPGKYPLKAPYGMKFDYITVHETGNNAPAINESNYMINNGNEVGFHVAIDDLQAVESIMFKRNAWHCGDGENGTGNRRSIGIEICYQTEAYPMTKYKKSVDNAILYIADVLHENKMPVSCLRRHFDWNGKDCPHNIIAGRYVTWAEFKNRVQKRLDVLNGAKPPKPDKDLGKYKWLIGRDVNPDAIGVLVYYSPYGVTKEYFRAINIYAYDKLVLGKFDTTNFHDIVTLGSPDRGATDSNNKPTHKFKEGEVLQGKFLPL